MAGPATARRLRAITTTRNARERRQLADRLQRGRYGELFDGLIRNIFVPTIVGGGFRSNVLPGTAEATVNQASRPAQTVTRSAGRPTFVATSHAA